MFTITAGKGFQITFENGYTVSIQFGHGNYCENRWNETEIYHEGRPYTHDVKCDNAEVAFWHGTGGLIDIPGEHDTVSGWKTPDEVAAFIANVSSMSAPVRELPPGGYKHGDTLPCGDGKYIEPLTD